MGPLQWVLLSIMMFGGPQPVCSVEYSIDKIEHNEDRGQRKFSAWELGLRTIVTQQINNASSLETLVLGDSTASLHPLHHYIPSSYRPELRLRTLADLVNRVLEGEVIMRRYIENPKSVEQQTINDFVEWCISFDPESLTDFLERIHILVAPDPTGGGLLDRGLLVVLAEAFRTAHPYPCGLRQSPQQFIYNLYNTIVLTENKAQNMTQFSKSLLEINGRENVTQRYYEIQRRFEERRRSVLFTVKSILEEVSRELWRCDPRHHKEGETFVSLTRLLQGYVENEVNMNKEGTCRHNCAHYTEAKYSGCYKEQFCSRQSPCKGKIHACQYIKSDMQICPAPRNSERRYEWIQYTNGKTLGHKGSCLSGDSKVDSWWRWLFWHCSYCMCICDQEGADSHRHFSLQRTVTDTYNNRVVVGIRFTKIMKMIHIQISEGTLLPGGKIDPVSVHWRPVAPLDINDSDLIKGKDYHTMSYEERSIDLDDLEGPQGHLVTGVRFCKVNSHLNFAIRTTPFNFTTGKLTGEKSIWTDTDDAQARINLYLPRPGVPTRSSASVPDSSSHQFLQFTHSDLGSDAAQTTVPYIDAQAAAPLPPVPLSGAGLYHKSRRHSGGFVAPKVITYDFSQHLEPVFSDIENMID